MITKICKKCSVELPVDSGFYANDNTCKECRKAMVRANRKKNVEYYRQYDRARSSRPDRAQARAEYARTERGVAARRRAQRGWIERNQKKNWAHNVVNNAIRDGRLSKPCACEVCGKTDQRLEGHHDDYDRPLDVRWLCSQCHSDWHKEHGEGLNG